MLADARYDSKKNTEAVFDMAAQPVIAGNPHKTKAKAERVEHSE